MTQKTAADRIHDLLEERLQKKFFKNVLAVNSGIFDLSRPNIHDNKTEFLLERDTVAQIIEHLTGVIDLLVKSKEDRNTQHDQMAIRLREAIEANTAQLAPRDFNESGSSLAIKNVIETGFYYNSLLVLLHMKRAYQQRLSELDDQEQEYWSVPNRPPNYYARAIALRFAKFYAREVGIKPTFGTSRDGPYPSTDYGRLLEEIFAILEMEGDYKRAGQWAVAQITDEDLQTPATERMGGLFGLGGLGAPSGHARDYNNALIAAMVKGK